MLKSRSYSPFRYAPWCFRDRDVVEGRDRVLRDLLTNAVRSIGAVGCAAEGPLSATH